MRMVFKTLWCEKHKSICLVIQDSLKTIYKKIR
nr:MAG TPA: hypothetical protein [Caudoviricetes sp.]